MYLGSQKLLAFAVFKKSETWLLFVPNGLKLSTFRLLSVKNPFDYGNLSL